MQPADSPLPLSVLTALDEKLHKYEQAISGLPNYREFIESDAAREARIALLHSLREMAADTARLDWLVQFAVEVEAHDSTTGDSFLWSISGQTLRASIDAARTPQPETRP
jgi:hypothetical protein